MRAITILNVTIVNELTQNYIKNDGMIIIKKERGPRMWSALGQEAGGGTTPRSVHPPRPKNLKVK